jgi:arginine decarboxylase
LNLRYFDLIDQTYDFPQEGFSVQNDYLYFNGVPLKEMIDRFGTPFKMTYLPKIGSQIDKARTLFQQAFDRYGYRAQYVYTYCTKSSHFAHVLQQVLKAGAHLELSSAFDTEIVMRLWEKGLLSQDTTILCNGYKTKAYLQGIHRLMTEGFKNVTPILDNTEEIDAYLAFDVPSINIGIRMATEEEPDFDLYTSRFGIKQQHIGSFFRERIQPNPKLRLSMLHFFIYTGIKDNIYYWTELNKAINLYAHLKQQCPDLHALNLGGGMPIRNSLSFDYDYEYMIGEVVRQIKEVCDKNEISEPDLYTEFGSFTVGESGAAVYQVLGEKRQNDREAWYLINNSLITTLPDTWGLQKKFILLAVNKWDREYQRVILGGLTCDNDDYYSTEANSGRVHLPRIERYEEPLYIGFFHTGAYQESLGGFGGIQHCLIPSPKHILVDRDESGQFTYEVFAEEQQPEGVMQTLGY